MDIIKRFGGSKPPPYITLQMILLWDVLGAVPYIFNHSLMISS